jgi:hypothetical protein
LNLSTQLTPSATMREYHSQGIALHYAVHVSRKYRVS